MVEQTFPNAFTGKHFSMNRSPNRVLAPWKSASPGNAFGKVYSAFQKLRLVRIHLERTYCTPLRWSRNRAVFWSMLGAADIMLSSCSTHRHYLMISPGATDIMLSSCSTHRHELMMYHALSSTDPSACHVLTDTSYYCHLVMSCECSTGASSRYHHPVVSMLSPCHKLHMHIIMLNQNPSKTDKCPPNMPMCLSKSHSDSVMIGQSC